MESTPQLQDSAHRRLRLIGAHLQRAAAVTSRQHLQVGLGFFSAAPPVSAAARVVLQSEEAAAAFPIAASSSWQNDFSGKKGQSGFAYDAANGRTIAVGVGPDKDLLNPVGLKAAAVQAVSLLKAKRIESATIEVHASTPMQDEDVAFHLALSAVLADYSFDIYVSELDERRFHLKSLTIMLRGNNRASCHAAVARANHVASSQCLVRDLANTRADVADPAFVEARCRELAAAHGDAMSVRVIDAAEMEDLGMGMFLGVGRGAVVPPRLVILEWKGNPNSNEIAALVGKGITYDTGGLNIKGTGSMETMYLDKHGGMTVIGVMDAVAKLNLKTNLLGCVALAENSVDALAQHPHDIVTAMNGKTIHVDNTDAEGRLVLGDSMTYVQRKYPQVDTIIDLATLTGAVIVALGEYAAGLWSNSDPLVQALRTAAAQTHNERVWHLPVYEEHTAELKHPQCDMKHMGNSRDGGACTAAAFLQAFVEGGRSWAHLDIAGAAGPKVGNGWGVQTLIEWLETCRCSK